MRISARTISYLQRHRSGERAYDFLTTFRHRSPT